MMICVACTNLTLSLTEITNPDDTNLENYLLKFYLLGYSVNINETGINFASKVES